MTGALVALVAGTAVVFTALLFARALVHKLADFTAFTGFVADYRLVPEPLVKTAAAIAVAAEAGVLLAFVVPTGLVDGWTIGALLAAAILLGYAGAIAAVARSGRSHVECGCGGTPQAVGWPLVARNGVLAAIAALGLAGTPEAFSAGEAVAALAGGFALFLGYLLVDQILGNAAHARSRA